MEERLLQAGNTLQQLEAELQAFQKSCLLQLARSSWVGRILRSSTGSVEVSLCPGAPPCQPAHLPAWETCPSGCLEGTSGARGVKAEELCWAEEGPSPQLRPAGLLSSLAGGNGRDPDGPQRLL